MRKLAILVTTIAAIVVAAEGIFVLWSEIQLQSEYCRALLDPNTVRPLIYTLCDFLPDMQAHVITLFFISLVLLVVSILFFRKEKFKLAAVASFGIFLVLIISFIIVLFLPS